MDRMLNMHGTKNMNKACVVGGLGFIGHHLTQDLISHNWTVSVIDCEKNYTSNEIYQERKKKILNAKIVCKNLQDVDELEHGIDVLYHLANMPNAKLVDKHPEESLYDLDNLSNLLLLSLKYGVKTFVYVSSSMVYGDFEQIPQPENAKRNPKSKYGILKYLSEDMVIKFCETYGINWVIVRPSAVYGDLDNYDRVVGKFIQRAIEGKELTVKGDEQLDFTYVKDTARGILLAGTVGVSGIYNITRGESRTLEELAKIVISVVGSGEIKKEERDDTFPKRGALSINRAKDILGYVPKHNLEQGIIRYYDSIRQLTA